MNKNNQSVGKIYKMNKYSKAVIEGLGYNVFLTDCTVPYNYYIQGVRSIVDKNTGFGLQDKISIISYDDDYNNDGGVRTKWYKCKDGKLILLEEYGTVKITADDLYIEIGYNYTNDNSMTIRLYNKEAKGINLIFESFKSSKSEQCISVCDDKHDHHYINQIHAHENRWYSATNMHTIEEFTPEYVVECIKESIKLYKNGILWNDKTEKELDIVAPALRIYAIDFLKEWVISLNNNAREIGREKRNNLDRINRLKNDNKMYNEHIKLLKDTKNYIIQNLTMIDDDTIVK